MRRHSPIISYGSGLCVLNGSVQVVSGLAGQGIPCGLESQASLKGTHKVEQATLKGVVRLFGMTIGSVVWTCFNHSWSFIYG